MDWSHDLACFFSGVFACNGLPHFVAGVMGRRFQTPFARPPGKGLSSPAANVVWGFFNFVVAYELLRGAGELSLASGFQMLIFGSGVLLMGLVHGYSFGRFNDGPSV